ncbi:MAG: ATP-binding cassette domain-containing protein [Lachnospiraceae bacterium]|nr:ATP-binding cassette domain-containing protein [Lachnospiraceae bacterium]
MLELQNITYSASDENGDKDILRDVSLTLEDNKFYVITGPNGSGKSSLAKIIAGIYTPESGKILFNGRDITSLSITERANLGISFAFQQPIRFKGITVKDLIKLAANGPADKDMNADVCDYLSQVGLCARDYINREVNASLSGGELKRIEIAMTLARKSQFTVFDEPEAGIDLWSFNNLIKVFEKLHDETHGSIVIISHQERIINIADEIILLADGQIVKSGSKDEIMPLLMNGNIAKPGCSKAAAL